MTQAELARRNGIGLTHARRALRGEFHNITQDILDIGSLAGGARAKAVIGWNTKTGEVVSAQFNLPDGYEHWLLKFDVGEAGLINSLAGFGRIEYAHYLMAIAAGVHMNECRLLEENGRAHFMTKRFDRRGNEKMHMQTLCDLTHLDFNMPHVHSYEQYLRTVLDLQLDTPCLQQAWLRAAFNVAIVNCDDHIKNLAFIQESNGKWTRQHQILIGGKAWNITSTDLLDLAAAYDIRQPKQLLHQVAHTVAQWPMFARQIGVTPLDIDRIQSFQQSVQFVNSSL